MMEKLRNCIIFYNMLLSLALLLPTAAGQPSFCRDKSNCNEGYFCDQDSFTCRECLSCERLRRAAPAHSLSCTTLVSQCGPCLPGLVEDPSGSVDRECIPPDGPPSHLWILLGVGIALLVILLAIVVYLLRKTDTFKIRTSTRASVTSRGGGEASAPPPPYNAEYARVPAPASPRAAKRGPSPDAAAREADASQAARVYNYPHYVRGPELPPSYESALDKPSPEALYDENTMESVWTPGDHQSDIAGPSSVPAGMFAGASTSTSAAEAPSGVVVERRAPPAPAHALALAAPHDTDAALDAPPPKLPRINQDGNNNSSNNNNGDVPPPLTFNIIVQQHNDLKLIRT